MAHRSQPPRSIFFGKRVLIAEDEILVALLFHDIVFDLGCSVTGMYNNVANALKAVEADVIDLAVLDINLRGEMSYPIAEALGRRKIPFLFVSGYGARVMPTTHPEWKVCNKPFKEANLVRMLRAALAAPTAG